MSHILSEEVKSLMYGLDPRIDCKNSYFAPSLAGLKKAQPFVIDFRKFRVSTINIDFLCQFPPCMHHHSAAGHGLKAHHYP